jgi:hypothetical protein
LRIPCKAIRTNGQNCDFWAKDNSVRCKLHSQDLSVWANNEKNEIDCEISKEFQNELDNIGIDSKLIKEHLFDYTINGNPIKK